MTEWTYGQRRNNPKAADDMRDPSYGHEIREAVGVVPDDLRKDVRDRLEDQD